MNSLFLIVLLEPLDENNLSSLDLGIALMISYNRHPQIAT